MTETEQQREGRIVAEIVLENLTLDIEGELGRVSIYKDKFLIETHKTRLGKDLENAKKALKWARGRVNS